MTITTMPDKASPTIRLHPMVAEVLSDYCHRSHRKHGPVASAAVWAFLSLSQATRDQLSDAYWEWSENAPNENKVFVLKTKAQRDAVAAMGRAISAQTERGSDAEADAALDEVLGPDEHGRPSGHKVKDGGRGRGRKSAG